jgi:hypothetical protein
MAYDFVLSPYGDWLFSGNRDILGISGPDQTSQRIRTRLRISRGDWVYDDNGTLGSRIEDTLRLPRERAINEIPLLIRDALEPMPDVIITDVVIEPVKPEDRIMRVHVHYQSRVSPAQVQAETRSLAGVAFLEVPIL